MEGSGTWGRKLARTPHRPRIREEPSLRLPSPRVPLKARNFRPKSKELSGLGTQIAGIQPGKVWVLTQTLHGSKAAGLLPELPSAFGYTPNLLHVDSLKPQSPHIALAISLAGVTHIWMYFLPFQFPKVTNEFVRQMDG